MSKYIIDTETWSNLFEAKKVGIYGIGIDLLTNEKTVWSRMFHLDELEELNSDYINEHFGELQDEAYQKGYDAGIIASSFVDKSDEAYQKGFEDGKNSTEKGCEGCKYEECGDTEDPCWHCRKNYKDKYEPAPHSVRIEVGKGEPCIIDEQTRQALNNAVNVLSEAMDKIREKLEILND